MKKITFMLFALIAFCWQSNAQVQIGSGTSTTTYVPITSCYGYTYSQQLFLASEINASGSITELSFYLDAATSTTDFSDSVDWVVYLGHSTKTEFTSTTDWEDVTNLTSAYSGTVTFPAEDNWFTITLDTPFVYNGTDNLVLAIDENTSSYDCSMYWQKTDTANDMSIYYRSDSTNPDPTAPPTATGLFSFRANTIFGGITQACPSPSDLTATNITTTSADLGWTENGSATTYNVEVVVSGDTPTGAATDTGVANGFTKPGLLSGTTYDYYVQANCTGGEVSAWVGPYTFTTDCEAFSVSFTEDFETTDTGGSTNPTTPVCWSNIDDGTGYAYVSTAAENTGDNGYYMYSGYTEDPSLILVSPPISDLAAGNQVRFYAKDNYGYGGQVVFGTLSDPTDPLTFTEIETFAPSSSYSEYTGYLPTTSTDTYFGFKILNQDTTYGYCYIHLDDIVYEAIPACPAPSGIEATNLMETSVDLSWTENGSASSYNVELVTSGTPATGNPTTSGVANPYTAMNLTADTAYDFYVQADCGGDVSTWVGPFTFITPAIAPACGGQFVDSGGSYGTYSASESSTWTITPDNAGDAVTITFTYVDIEVNAYGTGSQDGCWDYLTIYNGPDNTYPILAQTLCGEESGDGGVPSVDTSELNIGDAFTSTDSSGALTIEFSSDGSAQETGWVADVTCTTLGIDDVENNASFTYFPNPVKNTLTLNAQNTIENVTMYNMLGQEVLRATPNAVNSELNMSSLQDGAYFVKVTIANVTKTIKVIKQ